ncbi:hypothetical protein RN001_013662 [Aquatica leii]|uniref:Glyoxylate reductase/hydroxypyruvate reductase n=1 Tax=Aquatica leii TaxID=1421715 RepID=A0AAN7P0C4_9COLE|nr:hypothetical protein RN001_013662 [Aquatica leii]
MRYDCAPVKQRRKKIQVPADKSVAIDDLESSEEDIDDHFSTHDTDTDMDPMSEFEYDNENLMENRTVSNASDNKHLTNKINENDDCDNLNNVLPINQKDIQLNDWLLVSFVNVKMEFSSNKKVLMVTSDIPESAIKLLQSNFNTIVNYEHNREAMLAKVPGVSALFWSTKVKLDKEMIDAAGPQLEIVGAMSAGLDNIDVDELKRRNIKLSNTPEVLNAAVADIAVLLALAASRRLHEGRLHIENNTWETNLLWMLGQDLEDSTVGIVGLGKIGEAIVKRLTVFNVKEFIYCGHREKEEAKKLGAKFVTFEELLRQSDFVIISCPLTDETRNMFNDDGFKKMKNTAVLVNVGRGGIIDQPALVKALKGNQIFAAGLDVMTPEPLPSDHELVKLPNCVLIPHLGSSTMKTRTKMAELAANNIIRGLRGEELLTPVFHL